MLTKIARKWHQYKYRFVPWIAFNLKDRSIRSVPKGDVDKLVSDEAVEKQLHTLFTALHHNSVKLDELFQSDDTQPKIRPKPRAQNSYAPRVEIESLLKQQYGDENVCAKNLETQYEAMGFCVERHKSAIQDGGRGVVVTRGHIPKGSVVAMYPGAIYAQYEPILLQSIRNPFIFRCIDGILVDGNDKGISKFIFRSCCQRDRMGGRFTSDMSWLTEHPANPLAIGQYVNNRSSGHEANVSYQEFDIPDDFPLFLRQYVPNNYYGTPSDSSYIRLTRTVVLVSTRDITEGEELFSTYFTVVQ